MGMRVEPADLEKVACEVCFNTVPKAEATVPETEEEAVYFFCGLGCFTRWKNQEPIERGGKAD
jgi:hypothetical protein